MPASLPEFSPSLAYNTSSLEASLPANSAAQALILCVAIVALQTSPTINTPAGWTLLATGVSSGLVTDSAVFVKTGAGESSVAVTFTGPAVWAGAVAFIADGANLASLIDVSGKNNTAGLATSHPAASAALTTTVVNDYVVGFWGFGYGGGAPNYTLPSGFDELAALHSNSTGVNVSLVVAGKVQAVAGGTGVPTLTTSQAIESAALLFAVKPFTGPSNVDLTYPVGGEQLTAGVGVTLTCTQATSPTAAQSSLKYDFDYSLNGGVTWTNIGLSAAGVPSKAWTVPSTLTSQALIRVRSYDPALTQYSAAYDLSGFFSIIAETAPPAPVINLPVAGQVYNKAVVVPVSWTHGAPGNPQTKYTIQWSRDNFASHTATIGPVTSAANSTTIDFSGEAHGATISLRVKTTGLTLDSAYSATRQFVVASLPATPNITSPTNASPPNEPYEPIVFTSADAFVARRYRVVESSVEVHSATTESNATTFVPVFPFANGRTVTIYLSVKNSYGLWSAEDSETVTPSFSVPLIPYLALTPSDDGGYILAQIRTFDSILYTELWRRKVGEADFILVGAGLPANCTYQDSNVASGQQYEYFCRAYNATGFSDSYPSDPVSVTLAWLHVHVVDRTSLTSNVRAGLQTRLLNPPPGGLRVEPRKAKHKILGRGVVATSSVFSRRRISHNLNASRAEESQINALLAIQSLPETDRAATVCGRDQAGNLVLGKLTRCEVQEFGNYFTGSVEVAGSAYDENLAGYRAASTNTDSLTKDCFAFWKMEEATGASRLDATGRGNTLASVNSVTQTTGKINNGAGFNGSDKHLKMTTPSHDIPPGDLAGLSGSFAFALWFKATTLGSFDWLLDKASTNLFGYDYRLHILQSGSDHFLKFEVAGDFTNQIATDANNLATATWYFAVAWYDADAETINLQVNNGAVVSAAWIYGFGASSGSFYVGIDKDLFSFAAFDGVIDALGVWRRVLTTDERAALYNGAAGLEFPF